MVVVVGCGGGGGLGVLMEGTKRKSRVTEVESSDVLV